MSIVIVIISVAVRGFAAPKIAEKNTFLKAVT
jgi:hypothetical protein